MFKSDKKVALIGCTGHITELFLREFSRLGIEVIVLARKPELLFQRFPHVKFVKGSLLDSQDVKKVLDGVDAAFVVTPMGLRNQSSSEVAAGQAIIEGAKATNLKHLIYVSVLGADKPQGLAILDAKYEIEKLLKESGLGYSAIRCGSYMEDVFDASIAAIKKGLFLFPVTKTSRFTYTPQSEIPRFVVEELLGKERILNGALNFVSPSTYSILEIETLLSKVVGKKVKASGKIPLYLLTMLMPYFYATKHRFSSIIPLLYYFDKRGYLDNGDTVQKLFPAFTMRTLEEHLTTAFN